jgi:UDP-galactopyranose mutase
MSEKYDFIIVGSGLFGAICAYELNKIGKKVLVLEKRNHIGGNCYTDERNNINLHIYGPHIFHTSNEKVWGWINQFTEFNSFVNSPVANYKGELYSLPFNMWTFTKLWNISTPKQAEEIIKKQGQHITSPKNLEEQAIKLVGVDVYEKLIKGYTEKQWKKSAKELPIEIIKRLPIRYTFDNNYYNDKYQGVPIGGYTKIFEKLLTGIEIKLNTDFLEDKQFWFNKTKKIIYTGPIDKFYDFRFGELEYKTTIFEHFFLENESNFQGIAIMNFTELEIPYTRIIEHKHFEKVNTNHTWITKEYPIEYDVNKTEAMYPVNDETNNKKYDLYKNLTTQEKNVFFGGRLAEYKYYDMDKVIDSALKFLKNLNYE